LSLPPALSHGSRNVSRGSSRTWCAFIGAPPLMSTLIPLMILLAQGTSEQEHVPPDPPTAQDDHSMPYREMVRVMEMDDRSTFGKVMLDRLEWRDADGGSAFEWNGDAWYGNDYDKILLKAEGKRHAGETESARTELLWNHTLTRWWNLQSGVRHDSPSGASRNWAALGVQGLAPGFFDVEATVYVADQGRAAAR